MDQATRVLLATLAIPDGADNPSDLTRHLDIEEQHIANMRLLLIAINDTIRLLIFFNETKFEACIGSLRLGFSRIDMLACKSI